MSDTNYVILTVASVDFSYRETMAKLMSQHSKDLIANAGAKGTRFGSIGTGEHAGSLIFIQFYDDLNGYQKAVDFQSTSPIFKEIMNSGKVLLLVQERKELEEARADLMKTKYYDKWTLELKQRIFNR